MTTSTLADTCPGCFPGDYPATLPSSVTRDGNSLRAEYECGRGHRWRTWWDPDATGWPAGRSAAA